jgi:hypothetical protein
MFRFASYLAFWLTVALCIVITKTVAEPRLEAQGVGVSLEEPKGALETSPLIDVYGYENICVYFDYSPAREVFAGLYPFVEFPMVIYIVLSWLRVREAYRDAPHVISRRSYLIVCVSSLIALILTIEFRLTFSLLAVYDDAEAETQPGEGPPTGDMGLHTMGFIGLMIALMLVPVQNTFYLRALRARQLSESMPTDRVIPKSHITFGIWYTGAHCIITIIKIIMTTGAIAKEGPLSDDTAYLAFANFINTLWIVTGAIIPTIVSYKFAKTTELLYLVIDNEYIEGMIAADGKKAGV